MQNYGKIIFLHTEVSTLHIEARCRRHLATKQNTAFNIAIARLQAYLYLYAGYFASIHLEIVQSAMKRGQYHRLFE